MIYVEDFSSERNKDRWTTWLTRRMTDSIRLTPEGRLRFDLGDVPANEYAVCSLWLNQPLRDFQASVELTSNTMDRGDGGLALLDVRFPDAIGKQTISISLVNSPLGPQLQLWAQEPMLFEHLPLFGELPQRVGIERERDTVWIVAWDAAGNRHVLKQLSFPAGRFGYLVLYGENVSSGTGGWCEVDNFRIEYTSPMGQMLWDSLPVWWKKNRLKVAPDGDFTMTPRGLTCLLQDVAHALETNPGDLQDHPGIGGGLSAFFGGLNTANERARLVGQIRNTLGGEGLTSRLVKGRSSIELIDLAPDALTTRIGLAVKTGASVLPLEFVYRYGTDGRTQVRAESPYPANAAAAREPDQYANPELGRDLWFDPEHPLDDRDERQSPQWQLIEAIGLELDCAMLALVEMRDGYHVERAGPVLIAGDTTTYQNWRVAYPELPAQPHGLDRLAPEFDVLRAREELDEQLRERLAHEWEVKPRDGTVRGLVDLCRAGGFAASLIEGWRDDFYPVMATGGVTLTDNGIDAPALYDPLGALIHPRIRRRWAEAHLLLGEALELDDFADGVFSSARWQTHGEVTVQEEPNRLRLSTAADAGAAVIYNAPFAAPFRATVRWETDYPALQPGQWATMGLLVMAGQELLDIHQNTFGPDPSLDSRFVARKKVNNDVVGQQVIQPGASAGWFRIDFGLREVRFSFRLDGDRDWTEAWQCDASAAAGRVVFVVSAAPGAQAAGYFSHFSVRQLLSFRDFHRRLLRRQRAGRRLCYHFPDARPRRWADGRWGDGLWSVPDCFRECGSEWPHAVSFP